MEILKLFTIARYTFIELIKSKIIYNTFFLGIGICLLSFIATEFTYGTPEKVAIDFGLGALSLSAIGIAIFLGVNLISKEIENRTLYMILIKPLRRSTFLIGRILGMLLVLFINTIILALFSVGMFLILGGEYTGLISWAILFSFLESSLVLVIVIFFSLCTNNILSVIYTLLIYICGHGISNIRDSIAVKSNIIFKFVANSYYFLFPNFSKLNYKDFVLYDINVPLKDLSISLLYVFFYISAILIFSSIIFERKNLD